ncbi:MAG: plastocyanin/azurin family copper-binding protein [Gaiellaceae bacterium]
MVAALSTGHTIGLGVVAAIFVTFALASSFLGPRWRADFPGKNGLRAFIVASFVLFAAMLAAVAIFGAEKTEAVAEAQAAVAAGKPIPVKESEFHIVLAAKTLKPGTYTFVVKNAGKIQHDLAVKGGKVNVKTPLINPGATAKLTVKLPAGTYTLYCTVPGHRAAGMQAKLTVH